MALWNDSMLVGVTKIDDQHKKLIAAIDDLLQACAKGEGQAAIGKTLDFVLSYTKEHFADEEALQAQHAYPGLAAHKQLHSLFISSIGSIKTQFEQKGADSGLIATINKMLVDWLVKHINTEDKKYAAHIKSKGG